MNLGGEKEERLGWRKWLGGFAGKEAQNSATRKAQSGDIPVLGTKSEKIKSAGSSRAVQTATGLCRALKPFTFLHL